jgi:hypothetical protein
VGSYVTTFILPYLPAFLIIVIFRKLPGRPLLAMFCCIAR